MTANLLSLKMEKPRVWNKEKIMKLLIGFVGLILLCKGSLSIKTLMMK